MVTGFVVENGSHIPEGPETDLSCWDLRLHLQERLKAAAHDVFKSEDQEPNMQEWDDKTSPCL